VVESNVIQKRKSFSAFPSLHSDIVKRLDGLMTGKILGNIIIHGYDRMIFPDAIMENRQRLKLALDKILGNSNSGISEVTLGRNRAFLVNDEKFKGKLGGILEEAVILPFSDFEEATVIMDVIALFKTGELSHREKYKKTDVEKRIAVLQELADSINSEPIFNHGAIESVIRKLKRKTPNKIDSNSKDFKSNKYNKRKMAKKKIQNKDGALKTITEELCESTQVALKLEEIEIKDEDAKDRTILRLRFSFDENSTLKDDKPSDEFYNAVKKFSDFIGKERKKKVHFAIARPLLALTDAFLLALIIGWGPNTNKEQPNIFDFDLPST
jgi:hypothetical protein